LFRQHYPDARCLIADAGGIPLEEFFTLSPAALLDAAGSWAAALGD